MLARFTIAKSLLTLVSKDDRLGLTIPHQHGAACEQALKISIVDNAQHFIL